MATAVLPSYFVPAIAGAGMWMFAAYTYDLQQKLNVKATQSEVNGLNGREPFQGPIGSIKSWWAVDTRQRFKSVQKDVDHLGADVFLVDYGNGQKVYQYNDPRILL